MTYLTLRCFVGYYTTKRTFYIITYLPERTQIAYSLRTKTHSKSLICKTSDLNERNFIVRSLYKDCY